MSNVDERIREAFSGTSSTPEERMGKNLGSVLILVLEEQQKTNFLLEKLVSQMTPIIPVVEDSTVGVYPVAGASKGKKTK
jgi:hypothetical protein